MGTQNEETVTWPLSFAAEVVADTHIGHALRQIALLERVLQLSIGSKMPMMGKKLRKRMFAPGYGPLGTFSVKIDVAFSLGLLGTEIYRDLHLLRDVRNAFAHPDASSGPTFDSPAISDKCKSLKCFRTLDEEDAFGMFMNSAQGITSALQAKTAMLQSEMQTQMTAILEGRSSMCRAT